jgi:hypothetical protein
MSPQKPLRGKSGPSRSKRKGVRRQSITLAMLFPPLVLLIGIHLWLIGTIVWFQLKR